MVAAVSGSSVQNIDTELEENVDYWKFPATSDVIV